MTCRISLLSTAWLYMHWHAHVENIVPIKENSLKSIFQIKYKKKMTLFLKGTLTKQGDI